MKKQIYYKTNYESPVGCYMMASDGKNLSGIWLEGQKYYAATIDCEIIENDNLKIFSETKNWLDRYFNAQNPAISELRLAPKGSVFRQRVWRLLCQIPYGSVTTYGEIAKIIAKEQGRKKMSAQAVGGAVGHNPISIIIPCHRVISSNGSLTGYAGGIETKIKLLEHEKCNIEKFFIPHKTTSH